MQHRTAARISQFNFKSQNKHGAKLNIVFIYQEKVPNVVPILSGKLIEKSGEKSY